MFKNDGLLYYELADKTKEDAIIDEISKSDKPINETLYESYSKNLRKAVDSVFNEDNSNGLSDQLRANVSRFAAYKSYHATQQAQSWLKETGSVTDAKKVLHAFNRYQTAEYNTTVTRCRTAKQYEGFMQDDNKRLFPNLRWIPSRSATPREQHHVFWDKVWAKNDPFWDSNQPGNLWNCKCDWEETSDDCTNGNPTTPIRHKGLEGNPAKTGEVFTDKCMYVKKAGSNVPTYAIKTEREIFRQKHKDDVIVFDTKIGNILFDNITVQEITKGAKTDKSFFYKQEIALHFDKYITRLESQPDEKIDLTHNNHKSVFYQRKKLFNKMIVRKLNINGFYFQVKIGEFKDGSLNLYAITEPE